MNIRKAYFALLAAGLLVAAAWPAAARGGQLRLTLAKTWGYALGSDIQGSFALTAGGPQDLKSVKFFIDDQPLGEAVQAPFRVGFQTGQYAVGTHRLSATGETAGGETLHSNVLTVNMLSGGQGIAATNRIAIPLIVGIIAVALLAGGGSTLLAGRKNRSRAPGEGWHYGVAGGAICPKCGRPFPLNFLAPNMVTGKLMRCPNCGKWSIVRRASAADLAAAEAAEAAAGRPTVPAISDEEKLRRQVEDSRYR